MAEALTELKQKQFEAVIGLEIHVELQTLSKMFCSCAVTFGQPVNTHVCPVCLGLPGSLPVANKKAIEYTIMIGLALNCQIANFTQFHRKNYFYPDMPKNYQISQYDLPLCFQGQVNLELEGYTRQVGITRVHLEEDTGKLIHIGKGGRIAEAEYSLVDFNRAGTPLAEIVTEPDIRSPDEAKVFVQKLRSILLHLGVSDCNMEEGSLRCDANVSIRPVGTKQKGVKTEIKNLNSFRALVRALTYEIERQEEIITSGGRVIQETRHWDANRNVTSSLRSKEEAHDYRYFPDPDLVPLEIDRDWVNKLKKELPELPDARRLRFKQTYGLPDYDADFLTQTKAYGDFFEETVKLFPAAKTVSNWVMGELTAYLNAENKGIEQSPVTPKMLAKLLKLIEDGTISGKMAKDVFKEMYEKQTNPEKIVAEKGLKQLATEAELEPFVQEVLAKNEKAVAEYKAGKKQAFGFLVGQVMALTKGKANPKLVNELLKKQLEQHS